VVIIEPVLLPSRCQKKLHVDYTIKPLGAETLQLSQSGCSLVACLLLSVLDRSDRNNTHCGEVWDNEARGIAGQLSSGRELHRFATIKAWVQIPLMVGC